MSDGPGCITGTLCRKRSSGEGCYTLLFRGEMQASPGQFVMLWLPGVDEVPMSVSHIGRDEIGVTIKAVGEATKAICSLQKGCRARLRGPFGRGFSPRGKNPILVAGGVGSAPLLLLANKMVEEGTRPTIIAGAKTKKQLVLIEDFGETGLEVLVASDDGSVGFHGTASGLLEETLDGRVDCDAIFACGPEPMLESVASIAKKWNIWGQAALERLMKCGIGVCGSCAINGKLVCKDGPVFDFSELKGLQDFGRIKRDPAGRARSIAE